MKQRFIAIGQTLERRSLFEGAVPLRCRADRSLIRRQADQDGVRAMTLPYKTSHTRFTSLRHL